MLDSTYYDLIVIGGGIVGTSVAMTLLEQNAGLGERQPAIIKLAILEAEETLAAHQTGHNSGVIHSGLYYKPGSLKAANCAAGRELMYQFCTEHGIRHERCGKIVVATSESERPALDELERRGRANGLTGLRRLSAGEIREHEPHAAGIDGLLVPETGIVCYRDVVEAYARLIRERGGVIHQRAAVTACARTSEGLVLRTARGEIRGRRIINCAGLQSDRVARLCGLDTGLRIIPFRGEYYEIVPTRRSLVRNLIYPVPDPKYPFLGVHFTRMIGGGVEAGPNAVLALHREGYGRFTFNMRDALDLVRHPGFWRMAAKHWRTGIEETRRSLSKKLFVRSLRKLIPELRPEDVERAGCGIRAQAVDNAGKFLDDFCIIEAENMIHVLNAPSPAATASLAIGRHIADLAERRFGMRV